MAKLLAGTFTSTPVYAQMIRGSLVGFYDALNLPCWEDPNHRAMVDSLDDAKALLMAHGYRLGDAIEANPHGGVAPGRYHVVLASAPPSTPTPSDAPQEQGEAGTGAPAPVETPDPNKDISEGTMLRERLQALESELADVQQALAESKADYEAVVAERDALQAALDEVPEAPTKKGKK
jgi:hypothetical protein